MFSVGLFWVCFGCVTTVPTIRHTHSPIDHRQVLCCDSFSSSFLTPASFLLVYLRFLFYSMLFHYLYYLYSIEERSDTVSASSSASSSSTSTRKNTNSIRNSSVKLFSRTMRRTFSLASSPFTLWRISFYLLMAYTWSTMIHGPCKYRNFHWKGKFIE